ncbi:unnamed protein product [Mesocestoides corti]|uniref:Nuclear pore complex protein Nup85 n=1 Tax=Mesocestoides corti TaxID=53468 RepID=A0A0R3UN57_MESCO|nr:unnamed protein product [Mesocestoides corti]
MGNSCQNLPNERLLSLSADGELVKTYELLWHLAEIVLLQTLGPGKLASALTEWYFVQSQDAVNVARRLLDTLSAPGSALKSHDDFEQAFWPTALALVTQARPMEVSALLASHPKANSSLYKDVRQLLIAMPLLDSNASTEAHWTESGSPFEKAWHYWQSSCGTRLAEETRKQSSTRNSDVDYLVLILSILAGRHDCWHDSRVVAACGDWYFQFVGWLFYTHHFVETSSLNTVLEQFRPTFNRNSLENEDMCIKPIVDEVIKHILSEDILSVVFALSEKFNNWWMVAHFANLIKHLLPDFFSGIDPTQPSSFRPILKLEDPMSGVTPPRPAHLTSTMPDFFLLSYAASLAADPSLLDVALGYLAQCTALQSSARAVQASILQRTKPTTTRLTHNLIRLARKHQLHEVANEIARSKCRASLSLSRHPSCSASSMDVASICSSLGWAIVTRDTQLISRIITYTLMTSISRESFDNKSWRAIKEVATMVTGLFGSDEQNSSNVQNHSWLTLLVSSPELAFISRYAELQCQLNASSDTGEITRTLLDLLSTSDNNRGFHVPLRLKIHMLSLVKPHLDASTMGKHQAEALAAVVTELKATLRLVGKGCEKEDSHALLRGLNALLVQARAAAILRRDEGSVCGRYSPSHTPSEYETSEFGGSMN